MEEKNEVELKGEVAETNENESTPYDDEVMFEPMILEWENFDQKKFDTGVSSASEICGALTALKNVGLAWEDCVTLVMNERIMAHNIEIAKINAKAIEKQNINNEKNNL